jgi:DNA-binding transcriptional MerR regulator
MHVNQLAREKGVTGDTVRYYTRIGFLNPTKNSVNGYKEYSPKDTRLLRFILSARQLGFSVNDIGQILNTAEQGVSPCPLARRLIQQRLEKNEKTFRDSEQLRQRMLSAVETWSQKPDQAPTGDMVCHLIEEFDDGGHTR